jgi:hypothetical protein
LKSKTAPVLLLLTAGGLLVQGYHPWVEDAEIYLPGAEKILNPALFPFNAQFFQSHAHLTLFPGLIAASVRWGHLPLETVLFLWQIASMFLLLLGAWELSGRCFTSQPARWAGVALLAALLTLPVAGTALYLMDQYINPRNLAAFAAVFAVSNVLDKKYLRAAAFLILPMAIHPLMPLFVLSFCVLLALLQRWEIGKAWFAILLLPGFLQSQSAAYHQAALAHRNHYLASWYWYEWLGALGPMVILWWFSRITHPRGLRNLDLLCRALVVYEIFYIPLALIVSIPPSFESLARVQPMRSLHLVYTLFVLIAGGLLGEFVLRDRWWRWAALFVPLCAGMFIAQRALFPASAHVEWPWAAPRNPWVQAFLWIRTNTPTDARFALDPYHMSIPGEDENGFRAVAERSMLADAVKDSGAVTMFPANAEEWFQQVQARMNWKDFQLQDFRNLQSQYGVNWVVLQVPGRAGLNCPYQNQAVMVCRIE